jgi:hypothetical protein
MTDDPTEGAAGPRVPPTDAAWREAQRTVADRNTEARKAGKQRRDAYDKQIAQLRRDEVKNHNVYR